MVHREMFLMIHPLCVRHVSEYFETPTERFMQRKKKKKDCTYSHYTVQGNDSVMKS